MASGCPVGVSRHVAAIRHCLAALFAGLSPLSIRICSGRSACRSRIRPSRWSAMAVHAPARGERRRPDAVTAATGTCWSRTRSFRITAVRATARRVWSPRPSTKCLNRTCALRLGIVQGPRPARRTCMSSLRTTGIDISKDWLDVPSPAPEGRASRLSNDAAGFRKLIAWIGPEVTGSRTNPPDPSTATSRIPS